MTLKFWGRDAALWLAAIQAVLTVLVGFGWTALSAEQASLWIALINAIFATIVALRVRPLSPVVFSSAISAAAAVLMAYGLHLDQAMVASINAMVAAFAILWVRGQVSPAEDAWKTGVLGTKVTTPTRE